LAYQFSKVASYTRISAADPSLRGAASRRGASTIGPKCSNIADLQQAADLFRPIYDRTVDVDGITASMRRLTSSRRLSIFRDDVASRHRVLKVHSGFSNVRATKVSSRDSAAEA
jgi:hypothetical protein